MPNEYVVPTPYELIASSYVALQWDVMPLPAMKKSPPPSGFTGYSGKEITDELALGEWMETGENIALRLPETVIGIDIDSYKDEGKTFAKLVKQLGPLPESIGITSQYDVADGGTFFFNIPAGTKLKGSEGAIDVIHRFHRYSVAPPSIHPDGRVYRWTTSFNRDVPWIPEPDSFPDLPQAWLEFLTKEEVTENEAVRITSPINVEPFEWAEGSACKKMNSMLKGAIIRLKENRTGRHDAMVLTTWALTGEAAKGHSGYENVLRAYESVWQKTFDKKEQEARPLALEFMSALRGAQRKISSKSTECTCQETRKRTAPRTSSALKMWR